MCIQPRSIRCPSSNSGTIRQVIGWLALTFVAIGVNGCGVGGSSTPTDSSATSTGDASVGDEETAKGGTGGIMVSPAGGGGIVVGDPLEAGRAAPAPAERKSRSETDVDEPTTPASVETARPNFAEAAKGLEEKGAEPAAQPGTPATEVAAQGDEPLVEQLRRGSQSAPPARVGALAEDGAVPEDQGPLANSPRGGLSKRDEANADAAQYAPGTVGPEDVDAPPARVGALAEDGPLAGEKGALANSPRGGLSKRDEAAADAARFAPGTVGPEDVDAPPAARNAAGAAVDRLLGRGADGDERFASGAAQGPAGGEGGANFEIKRGTADEVAESFLTLLAAGRTEDAAPLIGQRAIGILAKLRDGTATPEEIDNLQGLAAIRQQENSRPKGGTHRLITFRADKKMLVVEAEQKEGDSTVVKLEIRDAPRRRR